MNITRTRWLSSAAIIAMLCLQGCYRYTYRVKDGGDSGTRVAEDKNLSESQVRWSYLWGIIEAKTWDPDECTDKGPSQVQTSFVWYSGPLAVLTLGIVVPAEMTIHCSTDEDDSGVFGADEAEGEDEGELGEEGLDDQDGEV